MLSRVVPCLLQSFLGPRVKCLDVKSDASSLNQTLSAYGAVPEVIWSCAFEVGSHCFPARFS